jgi:hypothetical protein
MSDDPLQHTQFDSVAEYVAALDTVCGSAQRTLNIFEQNYENIGFNAETRYDILYRFLLASPANRLNLLAHDTQHLVRYCPRVMSLLQQFSHSMQIFQTSENMRRVTEPFAVADDMHYVRRYHFDDTRGLLAKNDPEGARTLSSRFQEMWASSHPGASATRLGL